jgi:transposase
LAQGEKALSAAGRAGRKTLLDGRQRERLIARLLEGPERDWVMKRRFGLVIGWHLIQEEFGIRYHSGHVWKLLCGGAAAEHPFSGL